MSDVKLDSEAIEDICELFWEGIAERCFVDRADEKSRRAQGIKVRTAMREALAELERGMSVDEILDAAEERTVAQMVGRTQTATETVVSLNRRLMRMAIKTMRPFAYIPGVEVSAR